MGLAGCLGVYGVVWLYACSSVWKVDFIGEKWVLWDCVCLHLICGLLVVCSLLAGTLDAWVDNRPMEITAVFGGV